MSDLTQRIYELLPPIYRERDSDRKEALKELLAAVASQVELLEADIARLYGDWFIETCQDWVVPYIAELVGYRRVAAAGPVGVSPQADRVLFPRHKVANLVSLRRRKGTMPVLEELAQIIAGWPAQAIECYDLVGRTCSALDQCPVDCSSPARKTVRVDDMGSLRRLGTAFNQFSTTADTRASQNGDDRVRPYIGGVTLVVWRLRTHAAHMTNLYAKPGQSKAAWFDPFGYDIPLYVRQSPKAEALAITEEANVPRQLTRRELEDNLDEHYGPGKSLCLYASADMAIPHDRIVVADLSQWQLTRLAADQIAIDPELGQIIIPDGSACPLYVDYHYAVCADIGGGPYHRQVPRVPEGALKLLVSRNEIAGREGERTISAALERVTAHFEKAEGNSAYVEIVDSAAYPEKIPANGAPMVTVKANCSLVVCAARGVRQVMWPGELVAPGMLVITAEQGGRIILDGLLLGGRGVRIEGVPSEVHLRHITLPPKGRAPLILDIKGAASKCRLTIAHSIVDQIAVKNDEPVDIELTDSIVARSITASRGTITVKRCTILGSVSVERLEGAENTIFNAPIRATEENHGDVRHCYLAPHSSAFRRYHCQPNGDQSIRPEFISTKYGDPRYCRLALSCPEEIARGADDRGEMGGYHDLYLPQRETMLRARLAEYTVAGLEPALIFAD